MAAYRHRPDGIIEIVRTRPASRVGSVVSKFGAALSLSLIPIAALGVFVSLGLPIGVVAVLGLIALVTLLSGRRAGPPQRAEPVLRLAHAQRPAPFRSRAP